MPTLTPSAALLKVVHLSRFEGGRILALGMDAALLNRLQDEWPEAEVHLTDRSVRGPDPPEPDEEGFFELSLVNPGELLRLEEKERERAVQMLLFLSKRIIVYASSLWLEGCGRSLTRLTVAAGLGKRIGPILAAGLDRTAQVFWEVEQCPK